MRKLPLIALTGAASLALGGTALAARAQTHVLDVPMTDGSVAHIEYVGNVPPKVTITPRPMMPGAPMDLPGFYQRHGPRGVLMRQRPGIPGATTVAFGSAPAGTTSTTIVSTSNNGVTCTRTTESISQGPGKPPKVTSTVTGTCADEGPAQPVPPKPPGS